MVILAVVFSLPLWKVPVEINETYTETEYKEEPYKEVVTFKISPKKQMILNNNYHMLTIVPVTVNTKGYLTGEFSTGIMAMLIDQDTSNMDVDQLFIKGKLTVSNSRGLVLYSSAEYTQLGQFKFPVMPDTYYFRVKGSLSAKYEDRFNLVVYKEWDTETKEVTRYRQVPIQVEKQRTVTKYEKASLWKLIFRDYQLREV